MGSEAGRQGLGRPRLLPGPPPLVHRVRWPQTHAPQLRAWKPAAPMSELSAPETVSSASVSLGPGVGHGCAYFPHQSKLSPTGRALGFFLTSRGPTSRE